MATTAKETVAAGGGGTPHGTVGCPHRRRLLAALFALAPAPQTPSRAAPPATTAAAAAGAATTSDASSTSGDEPSLTDAQRDAMIEALDRDSFCVLPVSRCTRAATLGHHEQHAALQAAGCSTLLPNHMLRPNKPTHSLVYSTSRQVGDGQFDTR